MTTADRYARQRLIQWWDQDRLRAARVFVAGCGALGNEVLKNLALLGIGRLLLVDFDRVEPSNLSRTVLFNEADIGRPKALAAAEALARLNPEVRAQPIDGDLYHDVGLGYYRHSNLVIGCLDSLAARSQVGLCCLLAGVPYLDGGMWSLGGEVRWFLGGEGPCFECTLTEGDRERSRERRSCSGFRAPPDEGPGPGAETTPVPTVATTASVIGGLLAQEAAKWLCGHPVLAGRAFVYNGQAMTLHRAELVRDPQCPNDHIPYAGVIEIPRKAGDMTARELCALACGEVAGPRGPGDDEPIVELGRDVLLAWACGACGRREEGRPLGRVLEAERHCPSCGASREPEVIHSLGAASPYADVPLERLAVPPGEVLAVRCRGELRFCELTADV